MVVQRRVTWVVYGKEYFDEGMSLEKMEIRELLSAARALSKLSFNHGSPSPRLPRSQARESTPVYAVAGGHSSLSCPPWPVLFSTSIHMQFCSSAHAVSSPVRYSKSKTLVAKFLLKTVVVRTCSSRFASNRYG
jgi:hypothetical protein